MSNVEDIRSEFDVIAARARQTFPYGFRDADQLKLDGQRILGLSDLGEDFRCQTFERLGEYTQTVPEFERPISKSSIRDFERVIAKQLRNGSLELQLGGLIAITGVGVIMALRESDSDEEADEDYGDEFIRVLNDTRTAFGNVVGVRYHDFPYFTGDTDELAKVDYSEDEDVPTMDSEGPVLIVRNLVICDAEGYGEIKETYDEGHIPLQEDRLLIHKGFPLSELVSRPYM